MSSPSDGKERPIMQRVLFLQYNAQNDYIILLLPYYYHNYGSALLSMGVLL